MRKLLSDENFNADILRGLDRRRPGPEVLARVATEERTSREAHFLGLPFFPFLGVVGDAPVADGVDRQRLWTCNSFARPMP